MTTRLGAALLATTPVVDAVLPTAVVVDLRAGGSAPTAHGLAAVHVGAPVADGRRMVAWADAHVAHRFAGGPAVPRLHGRACTRRCWDDLVRTTVAVGIAVGMAVGTLWGLVALVHDPGRTDTLLGVLGLLGLWMLADLPWAAGCSLRPRDRPTARTR